jgi:hypothetical protein
MEINASTSLLKVDTGEYPMYFQHVRQANPTVSFPETPDEDCIAEFGFAAVNPTTKPAGDVVTEGAPVLTAGAYYQTWITRSFTALELEAQLNDKKRELADQVLAIREKDLADGFIYELTPETVFGVQLRPEDRVNLLLLKGQAQYLIANNLTMSTMFRSTENIGYPLTPTELLAMCDAALVAGTQVYAASWALKDQIEAATTIAGLPTIPTTLMA